MRKLVSLIVLSLILILGTSCSVRQSSQPEPGRQDSSPHSELQAADYFPLAKDVHKIFKGSGNEYAGYETYVDFIKGNVMQVRSINPGTVTVSIYKIGDGTVKKVYSQGEVYYRYDFTADRNGDEEILIKEPIETGTAWILKDGSSRSITGVDKEISTPAGQYKALEITTKGADSTVTDYYVKDVGHVKRTFQAGGDSSLVTSELAKLETGAPYKQQIRLFFPEFAKNRIVYLERDVEIYTNQDMKYKFQKELKTVPEHSGLTKVLTTNTQVSGPVLNEADDTVTVNFSADLVREMNAGTSLESMLLESMTDTFGTYYQKKKVIITIDGKPYSSGHFLMMPGEYQTVNTDRAVEFGRPNPSL